MIATLESPRLKQFSVPEYQKLIELGFIKASDRLELLHGLIVEKMPQNLRHAVMVDRAEQLIHPLLPAGWLLRQQKPIVTADSLPESDLIVVRGPLARYLKRHPNAKDLALSIEVGDSSLAEDREVKGPIYAAAGIPAYWIINLVDSRIEVYANPRGGRSPGYRSHRDHEVDDVVPLMIDGKRIAVLAVTEFFTLP